MSTKSQVKLFCIALLKTQIVSKQLDVKLGDFTKALQYLDREIVYRNSVILLWPDKISSLNLGLAESDCAKESSGSCGLVPMAV